MTNEPAVPNVAVGAPFKSPVLVHPGGTWPDNRGKHIQADGGSIVKPGDTYYRFEGEPGLREFRVY